MNDEELLEFARSFRESILEGRDSTSFCYAISMPLEALLVSHKVPVTLTKGSIKGDCHYWLTLEDGRILDATADQFRKPKGSEMPPVYLGKRPVWYGEDKDPEKPFSLPKPDQEAADLHKLFSALMERGVGGEAKNAQRKLAHLVLYFDFEKPKQANLKDIFAKVAEKLKPDAQARHLLTIEKQNGDITQWVQSAVRHGLGIETSLRTSTADWSTAVYAHVTLGSLKDVSRLAEKVNAQFVRAWERYSGKPGVKRESRSLFFRGLYDGMMDDPREPGQRLPVISSPVRQQRRQGKATDGMPAVHPYTLALELGRALRIDATPAAIAKIIDNRTKESLPSKAAA